jgi:predicted membrane protein
MKIKKILLGTSVVLATGMALYHACVIKKARDFEANFDKSPGSMDETVLYGGKMKDYRDQTMRNTKIGAFFGGMQLDFSDVVTEQDDYRMDISIINGGLNIIVPDNFKLKIVDTCKFGGIADHTVCIDPDNSVALAVYADVTCGGLNFENAPESNPHQ